MDEYAVMDAISKRMDAISKRLLGLLLRLEHGTAAIAV